MRSIPVLMTIVVLAATPLAQEVPGYRPATETEPATETREETLTPLKEGSPVGPASGVVQRWHTNLELILTIGVLAFGAFILMLLGWFLRKGLLPAEMFLKLFVLVIVVTAGLFVVVAGYTQDQIAPMMGLLGTLVGYLLGREAAMAAAKSQT